MTSGVGGAGVIATSTNHRHQAKTVFTVLYYKRKNKVHKSKGVSKMDGTLTFVCSQQQQQQQQQDTSFMNNVILKAHGGNNEIIYKGTLSSDIVNKDPKSLIDEIISIGPHEVEILDIVTTSTTTATAATNQQKNVMLYRGFTNRNRNLQNSKSRSDNTLLLPGKKRPVQQVVTNLSQQRKPIPQPQPKKIKSQKTNKDSDYDDDNNLDDTRFIATLKENDTNVRPVSNYNNRNRYLPPSFQKKNNENNSKKKQTTAVRSINNQLLTSSSTTARPASIGRPKQESLSTTASSTTSTTTAATTTTTTLPFFPGAVGNLNVPHSIRSVLKPHQIHGITFLWNCLTGNSRVATKSPHCVIDDVTTPTTTTTTTMMSYKGCILSDGTCRSTKSFRSRLFGLPLFFFFFKFMVNNCVR
jgi:hypothetical protein